jgi:hypothetical protein
MVDCVYMRGGGSRAHPPCPTPAVHFSVDRYCVICVNTCAERQTKPRERGGSMEARSSHSATGYAASLSRAIHPRPGARINPPGRRPPKPGPAWRMPCNLQSRGARRHGGAAHHHKAATPASERMPRTGWRGSAVQRFGKTHDDWGKARCCSHTPVVIAGHAPSVVLHSGVIAGLDPAIQELARSLAVPQPWMPRSSPGMTNQLEQTWRRQC